MIQGGRVEETDWSSIQRTRGKDWGRGAGGEGRVESWSNNLCTRGYGMGDSRAGAWGSAPEGRGEFVRIAFHSPEYIGAVGQVQDDSTTTQPQ